MDAGNLDLGDLRARNATKTAACFGLTAAAMMVFAREKARTSVAPNPD